MSAAFRCGHVAVVGRTNAGKSTLINQLVGEKVAIVSPTPQTTRTIVIGVVNRPGAQVVLVDTPGFHKPQHELNRRMMREAEGSLEGVDATIVVVDAAGSPGRGDDYVLDRVRQAGMPFVVALNKIDRLSNKAQLLPLMERLWELGPKAIVPLSARDGSGVPELLTEILALLPESPAIYPADITTDQTERFMVAELIREKILLATREEIPHASTVIIEGVQEKARRGAPPVLVVNARLLAEKENQKAILIGKGGEMLKRIGTAARLDIEQQLGIKCHLSLQVGLHAKWRDDHAMLDRMLAGTRALIAADGHDLPGPDQEDE